MRTTLSPVIDSTKANLFNQHFVSAFTKEVLSSLPSVSDFLTDDRFTFDSLSVTPSEVFSELSAARHVGLIVSVILS